MSLQLIPVSSSLNTNPLQPLPPQLQQNDLVEHFGSSFALRPLNIHDISALEEIHDAVFPIKYGRQFFWKIATEEDGSRGIVAVDPATDVIVGVVTFKLIPPSETDPEDSNIILVTSKQCLLAYILTIAVRPNYRKKGIGTLLMQRVFEMLSTDEFNVCQAVYLHVMASNFQAHQFYDRMNFTLIRHLPNYYVIDGRKEDSYLFIRYVNGGVPPICWTRFLLTLPPISWAVDFYYACFFSR